MIETIVIILGLLLVGMFRKDFTTLLFAGLGFVFYGLMFMNTTELVYPYGFQFGILFICYGAYVCLRSSLDLITFKRRTNQDDRGKREEDSQ